jgi:DNA-binding transcriptional MerR regulator
MSKSREAFRTISEVAEELDVPKHVLRFWEAKFPQIRPMKRGGGRRYYRPEDLELLTGIRALLHSEGYTIKGVSRILREQGVDQVKAAAHAAASQGKLEGRRQGRTRRKAQPEVQIEGTLEVAPPNVLGLTGKRSPGNIVVSLEAVIRELKACRALLAAESDPPASKRERRTAAGRM